MPSDSSNSLVVKSVDVAAVRQAMDEYAAALLARPEVEEVVVFGSFERGTHAPGSDLDVMIVLRHSSLPVHDRVDTYRPVRFPLPLDLFPFTREELEQRRGSPIVRAAHASDWRYDRRELGASPSG